MRLSLIINKNASQPHNFTEMCQIYHGIFSGNLCPRSSCAGSRKPCLLEGLFCHSGIGFYCCVTGRGLVCHYRRIGTIKFWGIRFGPVCRTGVHGTKAVQR